MRILLDDGVPNVIKRRLSALSISTVEEMGWRGIKNGALLNLMAEEFQTIHRRSGASIKSDSNSD